MEDLLSGLSWHLRNNYSDEAMNDSTGPVPTYRAPSFSWASVDGIIEWEELVNQDYAIPGSQAEVLDVEIVLANAKPLSQVTSGWLKLKGFTNSEDEFFLNLNRFTIFNTIFNDPQFKRGLKTEQRVPEILYFRLQEMRTQRRRAAGTPA